MWRLSDRAGCRRDPLSVSGFISQICKGGNLVWDEGGMWGCARVNSVTLLELWEGAGVRVFFGCISPIGDSEGAISFTGSERSWVLLCFQADCEYSGNTNR
jgi:hypothetical protein